MGWYYSNDLTKKQLIESLVTGGEGYSKPLAYSVVGNNLWTVHEFHDKTYRVIGLFKLESGGRNMGWGYKPMDESMGPFEYNCPLKFLKMAPLSENMGEHAAKWRKNVLKYHEKQSALRKKKALLKIGSTVKLMEGLTFGNGYAPKFADITSLRPLCARSHQDRILLRLSTRHIAEILS